MVGRLYQKNKLGTPTRGVLGKTPIYIDRAEKRPPLGGSKKERQNATALRDEYNKWGVVWESVVSFV